MNFYQWLYLYLCAGTTLAVSMLGSGIARMRQTFAGHEELSSIEPFAFWLIVGIVYSGITLVWPLVLLFRIFAWTKRSEECRCPECERARSKEIGE